MATDAEPYFTGNWPKPTGLPAIAQPVSVCHQWSITGTLSSFSAHCTVSGSARSPARKRVRNLLRSCCVSSLPWGSSFLMARNAVGAVNMATQPCSAITRQNAPASGVPTGLPSNRIEVQRCINDVAVADHPADVGGGPIDLARLDAVEIVHRPFERDHVAAVIAHDAFGPSGRARGVEDVERIGRRHWHAIVDRAREHDRLVAQLRPVVVAAGNERGLLLRTLQDETGVGLVAGERDRLVE